MKKGLAVILCLILIFALVGCGVNSNSWDGVSISDGEFEITPQELIDKWNERVEAMRSEYGEDMDYILSLPDFTEDSDEVEVVSRALSIKYKISNDTGNMTEVQYSYYSPAASDEESATFAFICAAIPSFLKPSTNFSAFDEFGIPISYTDSKIAFDGDIRYQYSCAQGMAHSLTISVKD